MTALPLSVAGMAWIPTGIGKSFRPLRFEREGWTELMRVEPGYGVAMHHHTGEVHAFNLAGERRIQGTPAVVGPGDYVYEPPGNVDTWAAIGRNPCIIHVKVSGAIEYLDDDGAVTAVTDSRSQRGVYLDWCAWNGVEADPLVLVG